MARDRSSGERSAIRCLQRKASLDIAGHIRKLQQSGVLKSKVESNPNAVRVFAADKRQRAWEYYNGKKTVGAMTEAFDIAIREAEDRLVTWRTTMLRVQELVRSRYRDQHPRAEGPDTRLLFSTKEGTSKIFLVNMEGGNAILKGGTIVGIRKNSTYAVMPFGFDSVDLDRAVG